MAKKCYKCQEKLVINRYLTCSLCKNDFDLNCAGAEKRFYTTMTKEHKKNWKCRDCITIKPKVNVSKPCCSTVTVRRKDRVNMNVTSHSTPVNQREESCIQTTINNSDSANISEIYVANIPTSNSFESLSNTFLDSNTEQERIIFDSTTKTLNRSCPELRDPNCEEIQALKSIISTLQEELMIAHSQVDELILENNTLKKKVTESEVKIDNLKTVCGSIKKKKILNKSQNSIELNFGTPKTDRIEIANQSFRNEGERRIHTLSSESTKQNSTLETPPCKEVPSNNMCDLNKPLESGEKHKIIILGNEHISGLASTLIKSRNGKWNDNYMPSSTVMSNATSSQIVEYSCNIINNLTSNDIVILSFGSSDKNPQELQSNVCILLSKLTHVKVYIIPILHNPQLNVKTLNYHLRLWTNYYKNCTFIDMDDYHIYRPGQYINGVCKRINLHIDMAEYNFQYLKVENLVAKIKRHTMNFTRSSQDAKLSPNFIHAQKKGTIPFYFKPCTKESKVNNNCFRP